MERLVAIINQDVFRDVFGAGDKNLHFIENEFKVKVSLRPEGILLNGRKDRVEAAINFVNKLISSGSDGAVLDREEINEYHNFRAMKNQDCGIKVPSTRKRFVLPKTKGQRDYVKAIKACDMVFATGPAGTGKTYLAMAMAVNYLMDKKISRIVLTRPAIEAGESLGFLPGDMYAKLGPYLRPLYDALYDTMEAETIEEYLETGIIEIAPLAYMRGRTLNNAFVVLDEAQNCTTEQLKMFLTRLGFDSKAVITGDVTQSDLPGGKPMGLLEATKILKNIKGIDFINLSKKDVVRHPLVQKIIQAYEDYYSGTRD